MKISFHYGKWNVKIPFYSLRMKDLYNDTYVFAYYFSSVSSDLASHSTNFLREVDA